MYINMPKNKKLRQGIGMVDLDIMREVVISCLRALNQPQCSLIHFQSRSFSIRDDTGDVE